MEHNTHIKSIKGHGVRVYRRCVPTDTEVPPPVPKRTTSMARSRAANSSSAGPARARAAIALPAVGRADTAFPGAGRTATALPARARTASALPAVGRTASAFPAAGRTATALPARARTASALPAAGRTATARPAVGRPAAALPVVGRPAAALPVVGRPAAALPVVGRPAAALPVVGRPAAALPVEGRPAAALPVVGRPAAALPVNDGEVAALPVNDGEVGADGNAPRPRPGIAGFVASILCKTTANISHGIEKSFRSLMSRRHHDSYRPAAVTGAFLQSVGLTGVAGIDTADVDVAGADVAGIELSDIELSDVDPSDVDLSDVDLSDVDMADVGDMDMPLPMRGYGLSMIMNGSVCPLGLYGDAPYFVKNSCPFDSVIVAVANAYMDYVQYAEFVDTADNAFLQLAKELGMYGPSKKVYDKRVELLLPFFKFVADTFYYTPPTLRTLDVECNVWKIVQDYLKRDPSSIQVKTCSNEEGCPGGLERIQYSASVVLDDCEMIRTKGVSCLHQLMDAYIGTETMACGKYGCDGLTDSKRILGRHVFIETDSLSTASTKFKCPLGDVPLDLRLAGDKFVLQAVIHFTSFHYVTYVRRSSGQWEIHNDLHSEIGVVKELAKEKVCPHAIIYIKT